MDTALLAFDIDGLHHNRLTRAFDAMVWMEILDATLARLAQKDGGLVSCFQLEPQTQPMLNTHQLLLLPISHDARHARLDHVLIHAPQGFDKVAIGALQRIRQIERVGQSPVVVVLVELGTRADFLDKVDHFGTSDTWQSTTPFLSAEEGHCGGLQTLERRLQKELEIRGLPNCTQVEVVVGRGRFMALDAFRNSLEHSGKVPEWAEPPKDERQDDAELRRRPALGLRLRFRAPVQGPIVLGHGARYGLGQFLPV